MNEMGVNPALGIMIVIFFLLFGLTLFYYGRKAIISRKAEYNDGLTKTASQAGVRFSLEYSCWLLVRAP